MSKTYACIYCTDDLHCTKYTDENYKSWCVLGPCTDQRRSNGDAIRAMSDEELAEYLANIAYDLFAMFVADPKKMWLDWLRQEVDT